MRGPEQNPSRGRGDRGLDHRFSTLGRLLGSQILAILLSILFSFPVRADLPNGAALFLEHRAEQASRMIKRAIAKVQSRRRVPCFRNTLERAVKILDEALDVFPERLDYRVDKARCLIHLGRLSQGGRLLEELFQEKEKSVDLWNILAWYYRLQGKKRKELRALNSSSNLEEGQDYVEYRRCLLLLSFKEPSLLFAAADAALDAARDDMELLAELAGKFPRGEQRERLEGIVVNRRIKARRR